MSFSNEWSLIENQQRVMYPMDTTANKIYIYNPFEILGIEFRINGIHLSSECIHSEVCSLCLCNPPWKSWATGKNIEMCVTQLPSRPHLYSFNEYYPENAPDNIKFYCLEQNKIYGDKCKISIPPQQPLACTSIALNVDNRTNVHPGIQKPWLVAKKYCMKPTFYDFEEGVAWEACRNIDGICKIYV